MILSDPVADMLTRMRNAQRAGHSQVSMPLSRHKKAIAQLLQQEGYILAWRVRGEKPKFLLEMDLKYHRSQPAMQWLKRVSRPGRRIFSAADQLPRVRGGLGVAVISTSKGLMSDRKARAEKHGGEVLCYVF